MIGFDGGLEHDYILDGQSVKAIYADLTGDAAIVGAFRLEENKTYVSWE